MNRINEYAATMVFWEKNNVEKYRKVKTFKQQDRTTKRSLPGVLTCGVSQGVALEAQNRPEC